MVRDGRGGEGESWFCVLRCVGAGSGVRVCIPVTGEDVLYLSLAGEGVLLGQVKQGEAR